MEHRRISMLCAINARSQCFVGSIADPVHVFNADVVLVNCSPDFKPREGEKACSIYLSDQPFCCQEVPGARVVVPGENRYRLEIEGSRHSLKLLGSLGQEAPSLLVDDLVPMATQIEMALADAGLIHEDHLVPRPQAPAHHAAA